jgi:type II secretory pathway pseudopilin PulG
MSRTPDRREAGFSLVGAMAGIAIMFTLMAMAMPAWKYVMQDTREEELIFRGTQIVEAIERYQKEKRALPVSFDVLVKGKFLRKAYADPMTQDGKWRLIHPGEGALPGSPGAGVRPIPGGMGAGAEASRKGQASFGSGGEIGGPFLGVASRSKEKSLRLFNGRSKYDEWIFAVGMPRFIGKPPVNMPGMPGAEGSPGPRPPGSGPGSGVEPTKPR